MKGLFRTHGRQDARTRSIVSRYCVVLVLAAVTLSLTSDAGVLPARGGQAQGHILYGDLKISGAEEMPLSFIVVLFSYATGNIVGRQTIANNGRYRFHDVANGDYDLIVEADSRELARINFILNERRFTDIRKDLELEWRSAPDAGGGAKYGAPVAEDVYARKSENAPLWNEAQEASGNKEYDKAIPPLKHIVSTDPEDFEAWAELGTAYFFKGDHDDAEKAYKRALELRPAYVLAQLNLGKLYIARKKYEDAVKVLGNAVEIHPRSADAHYYLGEAYLQVKKGSKAVVHLTEALRLDPIGKADAHLRMAALYNAAGMKDRAAAEYEQYLEKNPNHPDRKELQKYIQANKKP